MTTLDCLPWPLAILDALGQVVATNALWREVDAGHRFAGGAFGIGADFRAACEGVGTAAATEISLGTRAVLGGTAPESETTYKDEARTFRLTVTAYEHEGTRGALVRSSEVPVRKPAEIRPDGFYGAIVDAALDITTVLAADGSILYESASLERLLGYSPENVLGESSFAYLHPDDAPVVMAVYAEAVALPGASRNLTFRLRHANGSYRYFDVVATNRLDDAVVAGIVVTSRDVTDRIEAEEKLRNVQMRLVGILDATEDGVISMDSTQRITMFNNGAERIFGRAASDVIGTALADLLPPHVIPEREACVRDLAEHHGTIAVRQKLREQRPDGTAFHAEVSISAFDAGGERVLTAFVRDTTQRELATEALRETENRLRTIVEGAPILLFAMDRSGTFTLSEGKALASLGLAPGQVVGLSAHALYADVRGFAESFARALAGEDVRLVSEAAGVSFEAVYSPLRDGSGRIVGVTGVAFDVSERKRLELQLRQAQKMEALGTLAGGIAHDFNNLLAAIQANVELARADVASTPIVETLDEIAMASARAGELVKQILAFSRLQPTKRSVGSVGPIVEEVARLLRATLPAGIDIATEVDELVPDVLLDATQIHQVLMNLGTNAWHAMEGSNGKLTLRLDALTVASRAPGTSTDPGRYARVQVSDTGSGMDLATTERIFEPFFTTKAPGKGSGLGLAVVHGILADHGGSIAVESTPGAGTTFTVLLPETPSSASAIERPVPDVRKGVGHVLLIDDEAQVARVTKRLIERLGYEVTVFVLPKEGVEAVRADPRRFDVVITDQNMPEMGGLAVAREISTLRPDLPIVMISGNSLHTAEELAAANVRFRLDKPFTGSALSQVLERALKKA